MTNETKGGEPADLIERLRQEAQIHAQEARTANATIAEIYRVVTGGTGEPGNWHGAEPVRAYVHRVQSLFAAIAHGDEMHREWLKEAIECHLAARPVPTVRAALATQPTESKACASVGVEPIYQVRKSFLSDPPNVWRDAAVFAYDVSPEEDRRIVYAAPSVGEPVSDKLMKLSRFAHTAAHMSESQMRTQLADIADQLIDLATPTAAPAVTEGASDQEELVASISNLRPKLERLKAHTPYDASSIWDDCYDELMQSMEHCLYLAAPAAAVPAGFEAAFQDCRLTAAEQHALWQASAATPNDYSAGSNLTWQLGTFARKLIDRTQAPAATEAPSDAMRLIVEALEHSAPVAAHYPQPRERHAAALKAARALATPAPAVGASLTGIHKAIDAFEHRERGMAQAHIAAKLVAELRDALAAVGASVQPVQASPDPAFTYAASLATALFEKHFAHAPDYASGKVVWGLSDTTTGILTQIDNMVSGLVQPVQASLSDEQIDSALHELHGIAVEYDVHDYGLPMHDDGEVHRMRSVIRDLASSTPTKGGDHGT